MTDRPSRDLRFPDISASEVEEIITQCSDITLQLSSPQIVSAIYCASVSERSRYEHWIGMHLGSVVAQDSASKLNMLLADNAASRSCEGNWRHLNFMLLNGETVPLLLKYFEFGDVAQPSRLLCGRELSRQLHIQKRLQEELMRLERDRETLFSGHKP